MGQIIAKTTCNSIKAYAHNLTKEARNCHHPIPFQDFTSRTTCTASKAELVNASEVQTSQLSERTKRTGLVNVLGQLIKPTVHLRCWQQPSSGLRRQHEQLTGSGSLHTIQASGRTRPVTRPVAQSVA